MAFTTTNSYPWAEGLSAPVNPKKMNQPEFVVVAGTSAGGIGALSELVAQFTPDMSMAVFIVMLPLLL